MGQFLIDPNHDKCPECGCKNLEVDNERGEMICSECGIIIADFKIDHGPEWRDFKDSKEKSKARTGPPIRKMDQGLFPTTNIGKEDRDSYGRSIPLKNQAQIYRLRKWQRRIIKYRTNQRNLIWGFTEIDRISTSKDLPPMVREFAKDILRRASKNNLIRGRSLECSIAAAVYAACRVYQVPRTLNEIANGFPVSRKDIGRAFRKLARELDLSMNVTTPIDYLSRFCSKLELDKPTIEYAIDILKRAENIGYFSGKDPAGIAASAIYIAAYVTGRSRTQGEISRVSGISQVTIRNRYKELIKKLNLKVPIEHLEKI